MEENKKRNLGIFLGLIILLAMVIGVTYAAFQYTKAGTKENTLTTGTISFKYNETSNGVTLSNAMPTLDEEGKKMQKGEGEGDNSYFDFNVDSHLGADTEVQYYVYAVDVTGDTENKLDPKYVKVYLTDQSTPENVYQGYDEEVPVYSDLDDIEAQSSEKEPVQGKLLYQNQFTESGTHFYRLRLWVSNDYEDNKVARTFKMRVDVNTDAEITPVVKDSEKPTCTIENAQPKNASRDEDITMTIKCTDDNGTVTSNMTKDNIHVKVNNETVEATKKELTEGIATTSVTGNNGVQHTLTLNGFEKEGDISLTIDQGVIEDQYKNINDEINIDTGVSISKRVKVTLVKKDGVESIESDKEYLECDLKGEESCEVTLPTITSKEGYGEGYWTNDESLTSGETGNVKVADDTTYYAKANDVTAPVCQVHNAVARKVNKTSTVDVEIDCTDNSGNLKTDLTAEPLKTLIDGNEVTLTKSISNTTPIENGKRYTVHLEGFKNLGPLSITIPENTVLDNSDKGNILTTITTEVTINDKITITLVKGDGVSSIEDKTELTCEIEKDGSGCNVTLPNITPTDNTFTGYWGKENNSHEGINPGQITVTNNDTYYALVKKDLTVTYTKAGGVTGTGKESDTCTLYGNDKSCSVTLPEITATEGYTGSFWSDNKEATSGKNPKDTVTLTEDDEYFARGYKDVTITYEKTNGVSSLSKDNDSCRRLGDAASCEVTLPNITGNKGYTQTYWGESVDTEYVDRIQNTKVTLTDDGVTYYAFAKDIENPVCRQVSVTPQGEVAPTGTVRIVVDCTDNSGSISTDLKESNITVTTGGNVDNATKSVSNGNTITNGKEYTITLSNFSGKGTLAATIAANSIKDTSGNGNIAVPFTPGVTIKNIFNGTITELDANGGMWTYSTTPNNTILKQKEIFSLLARASDGKLVPPDVLTWSISGLNVLNDEYEFGEWGSCEDNDGVQCSKAYVEEAVFELVQDSDNLIYLKYYGANAEPGIYQLDVKTGNLKTNTGEELNSSIRFYISKSNINNVQITYENQVIYQKVISASNSDSYQFGYTVSPASSYPGNVVSWNYSMTDSNYSVSDYIQSSQTGKLSPKKATPPGVYVIVSLNVDGIESNPVYITITE